MNVLSSESLSYIADTVLCNRPDDQQLHLHAPNKTGDVNIDSHDFSWTSTLKHNGRTVRMSYTNPNIRDYIGETVSSLGIYEKAQFGDAPMKLWTIGSDSFADTHRVSIDYIDQDRMTTRVSSNPDRTYKALARLTRIHMNHLIQK